MKTNRGILTALLALGLVTGCGRHDHDRDRHGGHHDHVAPHGGTAVVLGMEEAHMELVLDAEEGKMTAYMMDAHMENFVRIPAESFTLSAKLPERGVVLTFNAVANPATGETVGDTSQFEAHADWLKFTKSFDALIKEITIKGKKFENVAFNFPKGNGMH